jgi:hypothetical protein
MAESGLAELQGWMQDSILAGSADPALIAERIAGDGRLGGEDRLAIYARAYRARLLETLRAEYPALRLLVGDTVFDLFAADYVAASPPRDPRLQVFGAGFADHLAATRPEGEGSLSALPAELARLERARSEVQRAAGVERLGPVRLSADAALLPGLRLRLPDSVRLLLLNFDFTDLLEAADKGGPALVPREAAAPTIVFRHGYRVRTRRIERWQLAFLERLGDEGDEVQSAAATAADSCAGDTGALLADLAMWLPLAAADGLVAPA